MYSPEELCSKIETIFPEIGACGINLDVAFDADKNAWVVDLKKDNHELKHFLEQPDADACIEGKQCVALGQGILPDPLGGRGVLGAHGACCNGGGLDQRWRCRRHLGQDSQAPPLRRCRRSSTPATTPPSPAAPSGCGRCSTRCGWRRRPPLLL